MQEQPALTGAIRAHDPSKPLANFSPGPAPLPPAVMDEIHEELLDFQGTGTSVMSMSHRSPEFGAIFEETSNALRRVLLLPDTHTILFTHGGGHGQFAAVPLNLCPEGKACRADYFIHGTWGRRAANEASKYVTVRLAAESDGTKLPPRSSWDLDPGASYRYICSNETVDGNEFHTLPSFDDDVPLVVDMSSDICSKRIDWTRVAVAFACAPKNIGHAGLTVLVVRRDLLATRAAQPSCPGVLSWRLNHESGGMWNTPPTFNIYTTGKVLQWMEREGGLVEMERRAICKAASFYAAVEASKGFYATPCDAAHRSRMNAPFNVCGGDADATDAFLRGAYERNMVGFRTKTPFGTSQWLRASFYTGTSVAQAEALAAYMKDFAASWGQADTPLDVVVPLAPLAEPLNPAVAPKAAPAADRLPLQPKTEAAVAAVARAQPRPPLFGVLPAPKAGLGHGPKAHIPNSMSLDSGLPRLHQLPRFAQVGN